MSKVINQKELYRAFRDAFMARLATGNVFINTGSHVDEPFVINIDDYDVVTDIDIKGEVTNVKV